MRLANVSRFSAEGTIYGVILRITQASFLFCILSHVALNKSFRNMEFFGIVCSVSSSVLHLVRFAFVEFLDRVSVSFYSN